MTHPHPYTPRSLADEEKTNGWRHILTHPRNGERVLATDGWSVWIVRYFPDMGFVDEGVPKHVRPTRWMPLPVPPLTAR